MRPRHSPEASAPLKTKSRSTLHPPSQIRVAVRARVPLSAKSQQLLHHPKLVLREKGSATASRRADCWVRNDGPCHPGSLWLSWGQASSEQHTVFKIPKHAKQASRPTPRNPPDTFSYLRAAKMFNSVGKYTGSSALKTDQPSSPLYFPNKHLKVANFPVSLSLLKNSGLSHRR